MVEIYSFFLSVFVSVKVFCLEIRNVYILLMWSLFFNVLEIECSSVHTENKFVSEIQTVVL